MTSTNKHPNPYDNPLPNNGKAIILVPLIIGSAVIVSIIMLWEAHEQKLRLTQLSHTEILARDKLRSAWQNIRSLNPTSALEETTQATLLVDSLCAAQSPRLPSNFAELKVALLLLEGESLLMENCKQTAPLAENKFDEALSLMTFSSGEMWQTGLLGRARTRYEQEKYADAITDLDQLMTRNPNFGAAYYWRSLAQEKTGNHHDAETDRQIAKRLDSWPPLRDSMRDAPAWTRDILHKQQNAK